jgi:hypothetical protein
MAKVNARDLALEDGGVPIEFLLERESRDLTVDQIVEAAVAV